MPSRLALKKLTRSDLTFFEPKYRTIGAGNQKAINLNADVTAGQSAVLVSGGTGGVTQHSGTLTAPFTVVFAGSGGRLLAADEAPTVLEGTWQTDKLVIMGFVSAAAARGFLESPAYRAISKDRLAGAQTSALDDPVACPRRPRLAMVRSSAGQAGQRRPDNSQRSRPGPAVLNTGER